MFGMKLRMPKYEAAAKHIRTKRRLLGLSQGALARKLELSAQQISNIERGAVQLPPKLIASMAKALDTSIKNLLEASVRDYRLKLQELVARKRGKS
jgi:transcriptional regulator with XRE-family HTH domain